jgi:hypothetical protein
MNLSAEPVSSERTKTCTDDVPVSVDNEMEHPGHWTRFLQLQRFVDVNTTICT